MKCRLCQIITPLSASVPVPRPLSGELHPPVPQPGLPGLPTPGPGSQGLCGQSEHQPQPGAGPDLRPEPGQHHLLPPPVRQDGLGGRHQGRGGGRGPVRRGECSQHWEVLSLILSPQISALESGDSFPSVSCPSKLVLRMECEDLQCGRRPAAVQEVAESSDLRTVRHGDWPWHVSLFKESSHVCDGTLVDTSWVISTKSCFQG